MNTPLDDFVSWTIHRQYNLFQSLVLMYSAFFILMLVLVCIFLVAMAWPSTFGAVCMLGALVLASWYVVDWRIKRKEQNESTRTQG
jgi:ABC-type phosphate transport system permease subunit